MLDPGRGRTNTGQLFAYACDDRPWGGAEPHGVAYLYAPDRKAEQPLRHLQGFVGILLRSVLFGKPAVINTFFLFAILVRLS